MCAGLVPKAMKQDWNSSQMHAIQQHDLQTGLQSNGALQCPAATDCHQVWNGWQSSDCWGYSMEQAQTAQPYMPQVSHYQSVGPDSLEMQPMMSMSEQLALPFQQQPQAPVQSGMQQPMPIMQGEHTSPLQMIVPQPVSEMPASAMMMPAPTSQVPASGSGTLSEVDRCMAIVMPQVSQFPCDRDAFAAQLRAAANCQCYED